MTAHAYALLDAYVYGFAIQEAALPFEGPGQRGRGRGADRWNCMTTGAYPHLVELTTS